MKVLSVVSVVLSVLVVVVVIVLAGRISDLAATVDDLDTRQQISNRELSDELTRAFTRIGDLLETAATRVNRLEDALARIPLQKATPKNEYLAHLSPPKALPDDISKNVIEKIEINKDCMILSYMPRWSHGNVDNIAVANNEGGVRVLVDWSKIDPELLKQEGVSFLLALYSRKTTDREPSGSIGLYAIIEPWKELTSWETQPKTDHKPRREYTLDSGDGWKIFDITDVVREKAEVSNI